MAQDRQRSTDVKVGLFVSASLIALTVTIFLIGQERRLFEKPTYLKAKFSNVAGLKQGAQVRLAGVDVGIVSAINFPEPDVDADSRVLPSIDLATAQEGLELPLTAKKFEQPVLVALRGVDPKKSLEAVVELTGTDVYGDPATERIQVRVRDRETIQAGTILFRTIEKAKLVGLVGNGPGTKLSAGDAGGRKITVTMRVSQEVLERIRYDSVAKVDSNGLLGDKTIDLSIGSMKRPGHKDGDLVASQEGVDIAAVLADSGRILDNVLVGTDQLRALLEGFRKAGGERTVIAAVQSIQDIAVEIQTGKGLIHQLIFDKQAGQQYSDIVADLSSSSKKLDTGLAQVDQVLREVREGDGLVHELLYGKNGEQVVTDARGLIAEATKILSDVREKPGFVHNLIYQEDNGDIMKNLTEASTDIKQMTGDAKVLVADAKKGKGTVGALLVDPSVYEDLKALLGNVRRNDAVKAIVRYAIEQEDKKGAKPPTKIESSPAQP